MYYAFNYIHVYINRRLSMERSLRTLLRFLHYSILIILEIVMLSCQEVHTYIHIYIHTYIHTYFSISLSERAYVHVYLCVMFLCICMYVCTYRS